MGLAIKKAFKENPHTIVAGFGAIVHAAHIAVITTEAVHVGSALIAYGGFAVLSLSFIVVVHDAHDAHKHRVMLAFKAAQNAEKVDQ